MRTYCHVTSGNAQTHKQTIRWRKRKVILGPASCVWSMQPASKNVVLWRQLSAMHLICSPKARAGGLVLEFRIHPWKRPMLVVWTHGSLVSIHPLSTTAMVCCYIRWKMSGYNLCSTVPTLVGQIFHSSKEVVCRAFDTCQWWKHRKYFS